MVERAVRIIPRSEIVEVARSWIGTPYRHQGRQKGRAIDCIGLVYGVWLDLGFPPVDIPANYTESPSGTLLQEHADQNLVITDRKELYPGDIAILWGWKREPQHFAIVGEHAGRLTMIHAFSKRGSVVEHGWDEFWRERLVRIYEFPGTEAV